VLENYWNGDPLGPGSHALGLAAGMTYQGVPPQVTLIEGCSAQGVRLAKKQMKPSEACRERLAGLGKWFITLTAAAARLAGSTSCS
jgi:hypothetical protein